MMKQSNQETDSALDHQMDRALSSITDFVQSIRFDDIPSEAWARARDILVDSLGCAIGGRDCLAGTAASSLAADIEGTGEGAVIGRSRGTSTDLAAFWNAAMIRYLDYNDSGPSGGHPSDMLGAHIALSRRAGASGRQMLTAIVVGHEVSNRISDRVLFDDRRLDAGYAVAIGAVAAGCMLLGLGPAPTRHALSISATSTVPIRASRSGQLSDLKGFATALSARDAVFYIHLAESGLSGPTEPFEGRHGIVELLHGKAGGLGLASFDGWTILRTRFKYWPAAYNTHPAIWAALELRRKVAANDIGSVTLGVNNRAWHESGSEPEKWNPKTRGTADHSLPFLFSRAFLDGKIDQNSFHPDAISEQAVRNLMHKISVVVDAGMAAQRPRLVLGCRAEITTTQGESHRVLIDGIPGHESNPLSREDVARKFMGLSEPTLGTAAEQAFEAIWNVEEADSFGKVLDSLVPEGRA